MDYHGDFYRYFVPFLQCAPEIQMPSACTTIFWVIIINWCDPWWMWRTPLQYKSSWNCLNWLMWISRIRLWRQIFGWSRLGMTTSSSGSQENTVASRCSMCHRITFGDLTLCCTTSKFRNHLVGGLYVLGKEVLPNLSAGSLVHSGISGSKSYPKLRE